MPVFPPKKGSTDKRPSLRDVAMADIVNGKGRIRKWPEKRGKRLSPKQRAQIEFFRQVQWAFKFQDRKTQVMWMEATAGTPFLPRDLFLQMQSGRFAVFRHPDGRVVAPMPVVQDVSESLDVLGSTPGFRLIRGAQFWQAVPDLGAGLFQTRTVRSTPQGLAPGSNALVWQGVAFDDIGLWSGSNPSRLTVPAGVHRMELFAGYRFTAASSGSAAIRIRKNGTDVIAILSAASGFGSKNLTTSTGPIAVTAGDYFEALYEVSSIGGHTMDVTSTFFSAACWQS